MAKLTPYEKTRYQAYKNQAEKNGIAVFQAKTARATIAVWYTDHRKNHARAHLTLCSPYDVFSKKKGALTVMDMAHAYPEMGYLADATQYRDLREIALSLLEVSCGEYISDEDVRQII